TPAVFRAPEAALAPYVLTARALDVLHAFRHGQQRAPAQANLAITLDAEDLHLDTVAFAQHVGHILGALVSDLRDVQQRFGVRQNLDERPEIDDSPHGPRVDLAHLGLLDEAVDDLYGSRHGVGIRRGDRDG